MMVAPKFLNVLRLIQTRLAGSEVNWALTGSLSFALQGVPVEPGDIDLQTDAAGAYEIERRLAQFSVRPVAFSGAERIRSHFGALRIDGIEVEIIGDIEKRLPDGTWQSPPDLNRHKRLVEVEGLPVPVLSLDYEAEAYLTLGRVERAAMLRAWLEQEP